MFKIISLNRPPKGFQNGWKRNSALASIIIAIIIADWHIGWLVITSIRQMYNYEDTFER